METKNLLSPISNRDAIVCPFSARKRRKPPFRLGLSISAALFSVSEHWLISIRLWHKLAGFGGSAFVYCEKKGLCGPSVLPRLGEGGHLSLNRGELIPGCVGLLFMRDKGKTSALSVWTGQENAGQTCQNQLGKLITVVRAPVLAVFKWRNKGTFNGIVDVFLILEVINN